MGHSASLSKHCYGCLWPEGRFSIYRLSYRYQIPIVVVEHSYNCLISTEGFPIQVRCLYIEVSEVWPILTPKVLIKLSQGQSFHFRLYNDKEVDKKHILDLRLSWMLHQFQLICKPCMNLVLQKTFNIFSFSCSTCIWYPNKHCENTTAVPLSIRGIMAVILSCQRTINWSMFRQGFMYLSFSRPHGHSHQYSLHLLHWHILHQPLYFI